MRIILLSNMSFFAYLMTVNFDYFVQKGDREALELWSRLQIILPTFFKDLEIKPSLLHGDLWGGNAAETKTNPGKSPICTNKVNN